MLTEPANEVTALLVSAESGADVVWDRLVPLVYDELHVLARAQLADEHSANTLTTTELVHEAYLRLVDSSRVVGNGRQYFFGAAARARGSASRAPSTRSGCSSHVGTGARSSGRSCT